jgi:hypothetical protein
MDYLSNYYKNLCEQLQEKLNILEARYYDTAIAKLEDRADELAYSFTKQKLNPKLDDTETDEDIFGMRQNAADQGGIPQDMVNEPIRRTKQTPDGRLIYGESLPKPKVRPNIGGAGPMIPKKPIPYPTPYPKDETMIPKVLDGFKKEQEFDNRMGIIPQTPEQRKKFGMSPFDNRMS